MIWLWLCQLDARLRLLLPFASAVCAVLIDVLPLLGLGPWGLTPFSTLCVVYFWSLYRPDLFGTLAAFATGVVYDALAGLPLGLTALILILARQLVIVQRRFVVARSFLVVSSFFLLLAPAVEIARWLLACIWWGRLFPFQPIALSLVLTMALYPIASVLLTRVDGRIPRLIRESERTRVFTRRALVLGGGQLALFAGLAGRLYYLQVVNANEYALLADENRINHRLLPPERGSVFDRHGVPLARNSPTYRVLIVREQTTDMRATLQALGRLIVLPEGRIEAVIDDAQARRPFVPITVREDLNWTEVARISIHSPDLPGVTLVSGLIREYPAGDAAAHVLGYVAPVSEQELSGEPLLELPEFRIGKNGVEKHYDPVLRGRAGVIRFEVNALGREIKQLYRREGEPGADVRLTLDLDLQRYVQERLSAEPSAAAVVLDVRTGEVLALASVPTFDPRVFASGPSRETWRAWTSDPKAPLVNKAIAGQYPPGSTFKMIVALAALEAGVVGPDHEVSCPGFMQLGQRRFHCWRQWGHGRLTLVDAIAQSCDVYFYDLARKVGVDAIADMARRFGLGQRLDIDLPGERPGLVPDMAWKLATRGVPWQKGETLVVGIGQGFTQTTPLQLAVMTARIANGGQAIRPWLARRPPGAEAGAAQVAPLGVSEWALRFVKEGMHRVINGERGTAREARLPDPAITMAGKTGTSQVRRISRSERQTGVRKNEDKPWEERDHALFVAFAPYRNPRYALAVVVEHGGSGSKAAAPIARDIMAKALELDPTRPPPTISFTPRADPTRGEA